MNKKTFSYFENHEVTTEILKNETAVRKNCPTPLYSYIFIIFTC